MRQITIKLLFVLLFFLNSLSKGYADTETSYLDLALTIKKLATSQNKLNYDWCKPFAFKKSNFIEIKNDKVNFKNKKGIEIIIEKNTEKIFQIIRYKNDTIKAIVEVDKNQVWNGMMYSWQQTNEFLGCANLISNGHEGPSVAYHKNGLVRAIANFEQSLQIGNEYQFSELGNLVGFTQFNLGNEHGYLFTWSDMGKLIGAYRYNMGSLEEILID